MSCVRKRRGAWTLDFRDQTGTRRVIQTQWSADCDRLKAEKLLVQYLAQIDDGKFEAKSEQRNFEQLIEAYLAQLDVRKPTRSEYLAIINTHIKPCFGNMKLRAITPQVVEQFRGWVQDKGRAVRTVNKILTLLSAMLKYAEGHRWIAANPCRHVKKLKQSLAQRRLALDGSVLTVAECQLLYAAAGSQRERVLFRMAVETGMRQGELLGLRWHDVDWVSGRVFIRQTVRKGEDSQPKTAAALRAIGLSPAMLKELKVWKLACPKAEPTAAVQDLVFPNSVGGFEDVHNLVRRGFYPALRRAGLRRVRFHDLRHTCASLLLAGGVGIKHVQAQLGHASAQVTLDVYSHLMPDAGSPGADAMHALFGGYKVVAEPSVTSIEAGLTHASECAPVPSSTGSVVVTELVPQERIELPTHALRMRCSTS